MTRRLSLAAVLLAVPLSACTLIGSGGESVERTLTRTFTVKPGATVHVTVQGGSITTTPGDAGTVQVTLIGRVRMDSGTDGEAVLRGYPVTLAKEGDDVRIVARREPTKAWEWFGPRSASYSARLVVPPDVTLDLHTSGGGITVAGQRTAAATAATSGGSIRIDGGSGAMAAETSGGSITVTRALASVRASTSGGSIRVGYVGPDVQRVALSTSGGSIDVGVDPSARMTLEAGTSGGGVALRGLAVDHEESSRSHLRATMNGGGGASLVAQTSGGNIRIRGTNGARD